MIYFLQSSLRMVLKVCYFYSMRRKFLRVFGTTEEEGGLPSLFTKLAKKTRRKNLNDERRMVKLNLWGLNDQVLEECFRDS